MDCTFVAIAALKTLGIVLTTIPSIVVTDEFGPGFYQPNVVYIADVKRCDVMAHEFIHHKQYLSAKRMPRTHQEYMLLEREARVTAAFAMLGLEETQLSGD